MRAWFEERTGLGAWWAGLRRPAPRDAAFGAAVVVLLVNQAVTGALLAAYYKPTVEGAHSSVEAIAYGLRLGWLVRSLHLWGSHLLILTLLFLVARALVLRSYEKPRELSWYALVLVLFAVFASGHTGQVLPLDEDGYNGALVAAGLAGPAAPLVLGGRGMSDRTVGRYFAAHVFVLPALWTLALIAHRALSRRHAEPGAGGTLLERAALSSLLTVAVLATLAVALPLGVGPRGTAHAVSIAAKPHWYLLPFYQALQYASAGAALAASAVVAAFLLAVPFLRRGVVIAVAGTILLGLAALGFMGAVR